MMKLNVGRGTVLCLVLLVLALSGWILADLSLRLNFLSDDSFYVTLPAKSFVQNGIPSIDGVNPTNGFHPLIFTLDVLLAKLGVEDIYLVNQLLGVGFLLLAAWLFFRYLERFLDRGLSLLLACGLLVNPFMFVSSLSGLESLIFAAALIVFYGSMYANVDNLCAGDHVPLSAWWKSGLLGMLAYLCRTEFLFHLLGMGVAFSLLWVLGWQKGRRGDCVRSIIPGLFLAGPTVIAFCLFGFFGKVMTGHFTQSSASQKSVIHELVAGDWGAMDPGRFLSGFLSHGLLPVLLLLLPFVLFAGRWRSLRPGLFFMICATTCTLLFYILLIRIYQWHYMASYVTMLSLSLPLFLRDAKCDTRNAIRTFGITLVVVGGIGWMFYFDRENFYQFRNQDLVFAILYLAAWALSFKVVMPLRRHGQAVLIAGVVACCTTVWKGESLRAIHVRRHVLCEELNVLLDREVTVGVAAVGIYAKFLKTPVINMDGAISWPALEALWQGQLAEFVQEQGVDVILEYPEFPGFVRINEGWPDGRLNTILVRETRTDLIQQLEPLTN